MTWAEMSPRERDALAQSGIRLAERMTVWHLVRLAIAETLLGWAVRIAPNDRDGVVLVRSVRDYMRDSLRADGVDV